MNIKEIKSKLKGLLKEKRFIHSCGVAATARQLAIHYQYTDVDKAELAGLIHDCAKNLEEYYMLNNKVNSDIIFDTEEKNNPKIPILCDIYIQ